MKTFKEFITEAKKFNGYTDVRLGFFRTEQKKSINELKKPDPWKKELTPEQKEHAEKVEKLHNSLSSHYKYNDSHIETIKKYTGGGTNRHEPNGSEILNKELHEKRGKLGNSSLNEFKTHVDKLVKHHKTPHDMHVYTGVAEHHEITKMAKDGNDNIKLHHHGFTSTSINKKVAEQFAHQNLSRHIIKIHVPKGHHGAYVSHHSKNGYEKEFILPRGTRLHVHPKPTIINNDPYGAKSGEFHVWHAKIVKE